MTITFNCPKCGQICAFEHIYAGRAARCTKCNERFIIPSRDYEKPKLVKYERSRPVAGFYKAMLVKTWPIMFKKASAASMTFLVFLVTLRFFISHMDYSIPAPGFVLNIPIGWLTLIITWGCELWYFMEIIETTAMNYDDLIEGDLGTGFEFIGEVIKSIYVFVCALIISELPFLILAGLLQKLGIDSAWLLYPIVCGGVLILPVVLLILNSGQEIYNVFRPDYIIKPPLRMFGPYLVIVLVLLAAFVIEWISENVGILFVSYRPDEPPMIIIILHYLGNLLAMLLMVMVMRGIGLFSRHYACALPWMD